jgi:hypothetical protein
MANRNNGGVGLLSAQHAIKIGLGRIVERRGALIHKRDIRWRRPYIPQVEKAI